MRQWDSNSQPITDFPLQNSFIYLIPGCKNLPPLNILMIQPTQVKVAFSQTKIIKIYFQTK